MKKCWQVCTSRLFPDWSTRLSPLITALVEHLPRLGHIHQKNYEQRLHLGKVHLLHEWLHSDFSVQAGGHIRSSSTIGWSKRRHARLPVFVSRRSRPRLYQLEFHSRYCTSWQRESRGHDYHPHPASTFLKTEK